MRRGFANPDGLAVLGDIFGDPECSSDWSSSGSDPRYASYGTENPFAGSGEWRADGLGGERSSSLPQLSQSCPLPAQQRSASADRSAAFGPVHMTHPMTARQQQAVNFSPPSRNVTPRSPSFSMIDRSSDGSYSNPFDVSGSWRESDSSCDDYPVASQTYPGARPPGGWAMPPNFHEIFMSPLQDSGQVQHSGSGAPTNVTIHIPPGTQNSCLNFDIGKTYYITTDKATFDSPRSPAGNEACNLGPADRNYTVSPFAPKATSTPTSRQQQDVCPFSPRIASTPKRDDSFSFAPRFTSSPRRDDSSSFAPRMASTPRRDDSSCFAPRMASTPRRDDSSCLAPRITSTPERAGSPCPPGGQTYTVDASSCPFPTTPPPLPFAPTVSSTPYAYNVPSTPSEMFPVHYANLSPASTSYSSPGYCDLSTSGYGTYSPPHRSRLDNISPPNFYDSSSSYPSSCPKSDSSYSYGGTASGYGGSTEMSSGAGGGIGATSPPSLLHATSPPQFNDSCPSSLAATSPPVLAASRRSTMLDGSLRSPLGGISPPSFAPSGSSRLADTSMPAEYYSTSSNFSNIQSTSPPSGFGSPQDEHEARALRGNLQRFQQQRRQCLSKTM